MFQMLRRNWPGVPRRRDIEGLFDSFLGDFASLAHGGDAPMPLDVVEKDKAVIVRAELPGVHDEHIDVHLEHNVLTIRAEKREGHREEGDNVHVVESRYGSFARSLHLPSEVDADNVHAELDKGVLTITLRKAEHSIGRKIQITRK